MLPSIHRCRQQVTLPESAEAGSGSTHRSRKHSSRQVSAEEPFGMPNTRRSAGRRSLAWSPSSCGRNAGRSRLPLGRASQLRWSVYRARRLSCADLPRLPACPDGHGVEQLAKVRVHRLLISPVARKEQSAWRMLSQIALQGLAQLRPERHLRLLDGGGAAKKLSRESTCEHCEREEEGHADHKE